MHLTSVKCLNLILRLHKNDKKTAEIIIKIHENLSEYIKEASKNFEDLLNEKCWSKHFRKIVDNCVKKMLKEAEAKYRRLNYNLLLIYIKIVGVIINL